MTWIPCVVGAVIVVGLCFVFVKAVLSMLSEFEAEMEEEEDE